jgi:glyoxylase-like metal-dependent hydrolase (beta-lactamase superfamily II)
MTAHDTKMVTTDPLHATPRFFGRPGPLTDDVFVHPVFVNTYALRTSAGLVLIDPGFTDGAGVLAAVKAWSDAPLHTAVYTHGHADHAFGVHAWLRAGARPQIVAQERCLDRFHRYRLMHGQNARINQRQFGLTEPVFPQHFDFPTLLVRDQLTQRVGELEIRHRAARGETDDALWVWVPERRYLFTGDLVIWQGPNCGNPQKVQRYPEDWADALETMAALGAEWLFPGHGLVIHGEAAIRGFLTDTARYLRVIIDQVRTRLNAGEAPEDIVHAVVPDSELSTRPYLQATYDHPAFIVRNLLRLWGGWWNGNAADLLPATSAAQAREIALLAGGVRTVVARGRDVLGGGDPVMASHLAEWATRAAPGDREAQALKRDVYAQRLADADCLMARGIFRAALNDAEGALGEPLTAAAEGGMALMRRGTERG